MILNLYLPGKIRLSFGKRDCWNSGKNAGGKQEIHYIGGSEILPPPLDAEEETKEPYFRLVVYIAKKFDNTGIGVEDLISIGTIGLIKSINTFNRDKNIKLATYASRCIENEILMYLRRNNKTKLEVSIDEPLNVDWDGNELLLSDILGTQKEMVSLTCDTPVRIASNTLHMPRQYGKPANGSTETVVSNCIGINV